MGTIAVRRAFAVLLATLVAVVTCYTVLARDARAATKDSSSPRPVIGTAVKYVRNADGSITQTR